MLPIITVETYVLCGRTHQRLRTQLALLPLRDQQVERLQVSLVRCNLLRICPCAKQTDLVNSTTRDVQQCCKHAYCYCNRRKKAPMQTKAHFNSG
jgi:hypothetical protein